MATEIEQSAWTDVAQRHMSQRGATLLELSQSQHVLVVFLRHAGCTFCREMLADLADQRARLGARGVEIAVVHMSSPLQAAQFAIHYHLEDVHMISDPDCELYEAFGLFRGTVGQLFGPKVWVRAVWAGIIKGHGIGMLDGDGFRMPGAFVLKDQQIVAAHVTQSAADQIDFRALCESAQA